MIRYLLSLGALILVMSTPAMAVTFDHQAHNEYLDGPECTTCHVEGAFSIVPDKKVCLECHDKEFAEGVEFTSLQTHGPLWAFEHRSQAKLNAPDCASCHEQDFCLECHKSGYADEMGSYQNNMANVHRSDFQVTHPIAARTDPQLCSSCHEPKFCTECHEAFNRNDLALDSHRRGFSDGTLGGQHAFFNELQCRGCHEDPNTGLTVLPSHEWSSLHAREARKNLATCQACHPDGDVCIKCHGSKDRGLLGVNPHPKDWGSISDRLERASSGRTCRVCH